MIEAIFNYAEAVFVFVLLMFLGAMGGWLLAILMGHCMTQNPQHRLPVGLMWIGSAGIVGWMMSQDLFWTNLLTGLAVVAFLARCGWEAALRWHSHNTGLMSR